MQFGYDVTQVPESSRPRRTKPEAMEFKFDATQEYQTQAIEAVVGLFDGQLPVNAALALDFDSGPLTMGNRLSITNDEILANLRLVQEQNGIAPDDALRTIIERVETAEGIAPVSFANFTVEMETGTGKTYVYLRTALELYRRYGMRKFVVVVPSVAVREGVLKTLDVTKKHFQTLYGNLPYRYHAYSSGDLTQVRSFVLSEGVEIMVMTLAAFNKSGNVIRQATDRMSGETPLFLLQSARPVLILDEPQNMESEKSKAALASLRPLFALRYSATHRERYNVVYRLTPYEAYRQRLVKQIEVFSVTTANDFNDAYLQVNDINTEKRSVTAKVTVDALAPNGGITRKAITVKQGDDLATKTKRPMYAGYVVEEINPGGGFVRFTNNREYRKGEASGTNEEAVFAAQLKATIEEHFRKQRQLRDAGIKVLSLIFIDRVANYQTPEGEEGLIRRLFDREFNALKAQYPNWCDVEPATVRAAYFAQQPKREGGAVLLESTERGSQRDDAAYDLIMRDKERLLSFAEPAAFVFSHSALREGWDNPNVFQICTLNQTTSEMKKRQEIGRGVRLAVNEKGDRVRDERINRLTVIANESYEQYVASLQREYRDEYGDDDISPPPEDARRRVSVRFRKERTLTLEFKALWEPIRQRTRYGVTIDSRRLIADAVGALDATHIAPPTISLTKVQIAVEDKDELSARVMGDRKVAFKATVREPLPNLLDLVSHTLTYTTPRICVPRRTVLAILEGTAKKQEMVDNPQGFATELVRILKAKVAAQMVEGIKYERINGWYEMSRFEDFDSWEEHLVPCDEQSPSVYDHVRCDSDVERRFAADLNRDSRVKCFVKLPNWFTVSTPVGEYNPDWAIVWQDADQYGTLTGKPVFCLVRETKGTTELERLQYPNERYKVLCGAAHFRNALGVDYDVVEDASQLPVRNDGQTFS